MWNNCLFYVLFVADLLAGAFDTQVAVLFRYVYGLVKKALYFICEAAGMIASRQAQLQC